MTDTIHNAITLGTSGQRKTDNSMVVKHDETTLASNVVHDEDNESLEIAMPVQALDNLSKLYF